MGWIADVEVGSEIALELCPEHLVDVVSQRVVITLLYKRGRSCRVMIDAPSHVSLEVTPPDGVTLLAKQVS